MSTFPTAAQKLTQNSSLFKLEWVSSYQVSTSPHTICWYALEFENAKKFRLQKLSRPLAISLNVCSCNVTRTPNYWKLSEVFMAVLNTVVFATSEAKPKVYPLISKTILLLFMTSSKLQSCKLKAELKDFSMFSEKYRLLHFPNLLKSSNTHVTAMVLDPWYRKLLFSEVESNNAKMKARQFFDEEEVFVVSSTPVDE